MTVSRRHCVLELAEGKVTVKNLSLNATFRNSCSIRNEPEVLNNHDESLLHPFSVLIEINLFNLLFEKKPKRV